VSWESRVLCLGTVKSPLPFVLSPCPRRKEKKATVQTDTGFANGDSNLKILFRVIVGGRSSMVEPQIVVLVVAGSSPVGHPGVLKGGLVRSER
jgi:hypothetical protein